MDLLEGTGITRGGKAMILAYDHGMEHGPRDFDPAIGSEDPMHLLSLAADGNFTAVVMLPGTAQKYYPARFSLPLILKVNAKSELFAGDDPYSPLLFADTREAIEAAKVLGAGALGYTIYLGSSHESLMARELSSLCYAAHKASLPVVAWVYPRGSSFAKENSGSATVRKALAEAKELGLAVDETPTIVAYAARAAFELGADMAKIKYSGSEESFRWAVRCAAGTKVVMSGGPKTKTAKEFLAQVAAVMQAGGAGVAVGRNVWQLPEKEALEISRKLHEIIFGEQRQ